jgi:hypothetical protein
MVSQTLTPFKTKHLWRRSYEGRGRDTICATIADEPAFRLVGTEKHTLHPGNYMTKLMTTGWVQGVWVMHRIRDGKEHLD